MIYIENNLEVSFSKVKYEDIAPKVGLDPIVEGDDIPLFEMCHCRLTNGTFSQIVRDLRVFSAQYGPMSKHKNEEARARYLSGVSSLESIGSPPLTSVVFQRN